MQHFRTLDEITVEQLLDVNNALSYLNVSIEEYLEDGDSEFFLDEIKTIIRAQKELLNVPEISILTNAIENKTMPSFRAIARLLQWFKARNKVSIREAGNLYSSTPKSRKISKKRNLTKRQKQNERYWRKLSKDLESRFDNVKSYSTSHYNFQNLNIGIPGALLRARQTILHKEISASFVVRGVNATGYFYSCKIQQEDIERNFDGDLEWYSTGQSEKRIDFKNQNVDPSDENDWTNQHNWLIDSLGELHRVFTPIVKD